MKTKFKWTPYIKKSDKYFPKPALPSVVLTLETFNEMIKRIAELEKKNA